MTDFDEKFDRVFKKQKISVKQTSTSKKRKSIPKVVTAAAQLPIIVRRKKQDVLAHTHTPPFNKEDDSESESHIFSPPKKRKVLDSPSNEILKNLSCKEEDFKTIIDDSDEGQ
jgi:hypothetical protein